MTALPATARPPAARVVFCDAAAYDAGYLPVAEIAGRVRVRGRGGTILQPGIRLLARAEEFPAVAPILVITDGYRDGSGSAASTGARCRAAAIHSARPVFRMR